MFDHSSQTIRPNPINRASFFSFSCLTSLSGESISEHEHRPNPGSTELVKKKQKKKKLQQEADVVPQDSALLHWSLWEGASYDFQVFPESRNETWMAGKTLKVAVKS